MPTNKKYKQKHKQKIQHNKNNTKIPTNKKYTKIQKIQKYKKYTTKNYNHKKYNHQTMPNIIKIQKKTECKTQLQNNKNN